MKRVNVLQTVFLTYSFNAKPNDAVVNFGIPDTIIGYDPAENNYGQLKTTLGSGHQLTPGG